MIKGIAILLIYIVGCTLMLGLFLNKNKSQNKEWVTLTSLYLWGAYTAIYGVLLCGLKTFC